MIVGIDTSGQVCSVCAVSNGSIVSEFSVNHNKTHSAMLLPMLKEMIDKADLSLEEADAFAVANGPGSFTGLRIGAATAKGLAFSLDKPVIGVSTLDALSFNMSHFQDIVCPIMDARRGEVYTAAYDYGKKDLDAIRSPEVERQAVSILEMLKKLSNLKRPVVFLGDGVFAYKDVIKDNARFEYSFAPEKQNLQRASSVAILGEMYFKEGLSDPGNSLKLEYLRRPQAERERLGL